MHRMRSHYDPQRVMLPVRELRESSPFLLNDQESHLKLAWAGRKRTVGQRIANMEESADLKDLRGVSGQMLVQITRTRSHSLRYLRQFYHNSPSPVPA